jgi:hypothetical protein
MRDHPKTNRVHAWIENVGKMRRRVHPAPLNRIYAGTLGYIFGDRLKVGARLRRAKSETWFSGELM